MYIYIDVKYIQQQQLLLEEELRLFYRALDCLTESYNEAKANGFEELVPRLKAQLEYVEKHIWWVKNRYSFLDDVIERTVMVNSQCDVLFEDTLKFLSNGQ